MLIPSISTSYYWNHLSLGKIAKQLNDYFSGLNPVISSTEYLNWLGVPA